MSASKDSARPQTGRRKSLDLVSIHGSARPGNLTGMALRLCIDEARQIAAVRRVDVVDPVPLDLRPPGLGESTPELQQIIEQVQQCDGLILSTPEYHGSYSSTLKLVIDNLGFPSALAGKPIVMLGVAAGQIGAIKALEHLRSVCSHVGAMVLPSPVSVASARQFFDDQGNCLDPRLEQRVRGLAHKLVDYLLDTTCPDEALEEVVRDDEEEAR